MPADSAWMAVLAARASHDVCDVSLIAGRQDAWTEQWIERIGLARPWPEALAAREIELFGLVVPRPGTSRRGARSSSAARTPPTYHPTPCCRSGVPGSTAPGTPWRANGAGTRCWERASCSPGFLRGQHGGGHNDSVAGPRAVRPAHRAGGPPRGLEVPDTRGLRLGNRGGPRAGAQQGTRLGDAGTPPHRGIPGPQGARDARAQCASSHDDGRCSPRLNYVQFRAVRGGVG